MRAITVEFSHLEWVNIPRVWRNANTGRCARTFDALSRVRRRRPRMGTRMYLSGNMYRLRHMVISVPEMRSRWVPVLLVRRVG